MDPDVVWDGKRGRSKDGYIDGVVMVEGEVAVLGVNVGVLNPIVTNGDGNPLFPNYSGEDLFTLTICGNNVTILHRFRDRHTTTFIAHVTACDRQKSLTINNTFNITVT